MMNAHIFPLVSTRRIQTWPHRRRAERRGLVPHRRGTQWEFALQAGNPFANQLLWLHCPCAVKQLRGDVTAANPTLV